MKETFLSVGSPLFIGLLTDLHNHPFDEIIDSVRNRRPDILCIAGDLILGHAPEEGHLCVEEQEHVLPFLRALTALAPVFLSLGNHEWPLCEGDLELIASTGCILLDNNWVRHGDVVIGGQTSAYVTESRRQRDAGEDPNPRPVPQGHSLTGLRGLASAYRLVPDTGWLPSFCAQPGFRILLCHHPEYYPVCLQSLDIPLVLSGHAHGGQWQFLGRGVFAPGQGLFPALTHGVYDHRLVVSRGLSNTTQIPRLNNPTEIVYIR